MVRTFARGNELVIITHLGFNFYKNHEFVRDGELNESETYDFMRGLVALGFKEVCFLSTGLAN